MFYGKEEIFSIPVISFFKTIDAKYKWSARSNKQRQFTFVRGIELAVVFLRTKYCTCHIVI